MKGQNELAQFDGPQKGFAVRQNGQLFTYVEENNGYAVDILCALIAHLQLTNSQFRKLDELCDADGKRWAGAHWKMPGNCLGTDPHQRSVLDWCVEVAPVTSTIEQRVQHLADQLGIEIGLKLWNEKPLTGIQIEPSILERVGNFLKR